MVVGRQGVLAYLLIKAEFRGCGNTGADPGALT